mgnify:CR=1 FL=1
MSEAVEKNVSMDVTPEPTPTAKTQQHTVSLPAPGKPLGQQLALEILCKAVHLAQSRGAYKLDEASVFNRAINEFVSK